MVGDSVVNVVGRFSVFFVGDDLDFLKWNRTTHHITFDILTGFVCRGIIDVNNTIIFIVLHKDRVEISEIKSCGNIFIRRYNNTERHLFLFELTNFIVTFEVFLFALN